MSKFSVRAVSAIAALKFWIGDDERSLLMDGSSRIEGGRNELSRVEQTFGGTFRFFRSLREGILCRGLLLYLLSF